MKSIYLAIEERIGTIATAVLFAVIFVAIAVGVLSIEQVIDYLNLFM